MAFERLNPNLAVNIGGAAGGLQLGGGLASPAARIASTPVIVEVGREAVRADILRNGLAVPDLTVDPAVISTVLLPVAIATKVVTQSVEAGRAVPRGTAIDLTVAQAGRLPVKVFTGVHEALANQAVDDVFATFIQPNPAIRSIMSRVNDPASLTASDHEALQAVLAQNNVPIEDTPGRDEASAFTALLAANLLHG